MTATLPFGSRQAHAVEALFLNEDRLKKNVRLAREISAGLEEVFDPLDGGLATAMPFDSSKLERYLEFVAIGQIYSELKIRITDEKPLSLVVTSSADELLVSKFLNPQTSTGPSSMNVLVKNGEIGGGGLRYWSITSFERPVVSIWRFVLFEGLTIAGSEGDSSPFLWTFVAPKSQISHLMGLLR